MSEITEEINKALNDITKIHTVDRYRQWLRTLLEENERLKDIDERESLFTINLRKELETLQESYDAEQMNASDAIAERNDLQAELQQLREELSEEKRHSTLGWEQSNKWLEENGRLRAELDAMTNEMKVYKHSYDATLIQYQTISTELAEKDNVLEWIRDAGTDYQSIQKAREVLSQFKKGVITDDSKDA